MSSLVKNLLWPDFCAVCQKRGYLFCPFCRSHLCSIEHDLPLSRKKTKSIRRIWSAVEYRDTAVTLIHRVKYEHCWAYTSVMAEIMAERLGSFLRAESVDLLIPVPLDSGRQRWRGFNQAELLARHLGKLLVLPVATHSLRRLHAHGHQAQQNRNQRQNIQQDFEARKEQIWGKNICLVDDVVTTGATLEACAQALTAVGARNIFAVTFAAA